MSVGKALSTLGPLVAVHVLAGPACGQAHLTTYETRYYIIHSDLDRDAVRQAASRITAMAEMYWQRTKGFGGTIKTKFPFYLFSDPQDYYAAGGIPGSAGVFDGERLMAIAGAAMGDETWHVIQHEGFHQFVYAVIGGDIPIWVNEGLAEYFGQGIYTGDGYVTGLIPPERLARLQRWLAQHKTKSIAEIMTTSHAAWNAGLSVVNYDQAWSMVHFLAHAHHGRYQPAFNAFIGDVSRGMKWEHAWHKDFGSGTHEFEQQWRQYWLNMPPNATADRYAEATVATLTSFYARAFSQRQIFRTFDEFVAAGRAGTLKSDADDWLPPGLLHAALQRAEQLGDWQIRKRTGGYELACTLADGTTLAGRFKVRDHRIQPGSVTVTTR